MSISEIDKLEVNKDQTNFLRQCKDLFKYIKRKIIKIYVCPDFSNEQSSTPNPWSYINKQDNLTETEKCFDIFKDDTFLPLVQKCYEALDNIIKKMDENRKKVEFMKKNMEVGEKKMKLLSELNSQLNNFFNKEINNSSDENNENKDKIMEQLSLAKTFNLLNDLQTINSINSLNDFPSKQSNYKDNVNKKNDNINENTELTGDFSDETNTCDKISFIGQKRELNFKDIMELDKNNPKKANFENISFSSKFNPRNSSFSKSFSKNKINYNKKEISQSHIDFENILRSEFSAVYIPENEFLSEQNKDYILEIKNILKRISSIRFPQGKNKFDNPYLIGSHKIFKLKYLLNSIPSIDILFKCREIKNLEEIDLISEETMTNKLKLGYIEICKAYDKYSEIIKVTNKCKITINENVFFIYINLFFVDVQSSNYIKKEKCFSDYLYKNKIYNNNDVILICLFFRRWRRKFKLFFIMPEFLDIIIYLYYSHTEQKNIAIIIENIFFDLSNNQINYSNIKGNNLLCYFINEWYNNVENKEAINNAISTTNEYLLKNDFLSLVKSD